MGHPKNENPKVGIAHSEAIMEGTAKTLIRQLHQQINLTIGTTHKLLRKDLEVYPYDTKAVQELLPVDFPRRSEFCNWFVNMKNNRELEQKIIFSDER